MAWIQPKKSYGQHFLKDPSLAYQIVQCVNNIDALPLLEIGPGTGVLTQYMKDKPDFFAIEVDPEALEYLKNKYPDFENRLIYNDFMQVDLNTIFTDHFNIIGNFPYNISSQILFKVLEHKNQVDQVVCMLQKEVAERIASKHGHKAYGILSVLLQAYYDIEYLFTVNEDQFIPPPKVKSAIVRLTRNSTSKLDCDEVLLKKVVKMAFNQRRKTMRNSLGAFTEIPRERFTDDVFNKRPEQLSVEQFVTLTNLIEQYISNGK